MTAILHSNLETDLRMASKLAAGIRVSLVDQASVIDVPGMVLNVGSVNGEGSDTASIGYASLGGSDHSTATAAENTDVSTTALTDTSITIAVVRHALRRDIDDLAALTAQSGFDIRVASLAADLANSARLGWMDILAGVIDGASTNVGTSGADMTVDDWYDAKFQLQLTSNQVESVFCLLHARQLSDFQESLRAEGGAVQYQPATAEMLAIKGQGYAGRFQGVDIFTSSTVDTDATDRSGAMWSSGAVLWMHGTPPRPNAGTAWEQVNEWMAVEIQRDASAATTEIISHEYYGITLAEQNRIVGIVTDA